MKTITIRGIELELEKTIKFNASRESLSINQWVLKALRHSAGLDKEKKFRKYDDLNSLAGGWSKKETETFLENIKIFDRIDEEVWK